MKTSQKSQPAIIVRPGHAISTAMIKGKNLESVKNQLIIILDNNLYMSNKKTGETIDIESRLPASGGVGDDEHYHIYVKGKINKVLAPNMIIFRLVGRFGIDSDVSLTASYLKNEPLLGRFVQKIIRKLNPLEQSKGTSKPKIQLGTEVGIQKLRELREECIRNKHPILKRRIALERAGISDNTVKVHDPELWKRWNDRDYR